MKKPIKGEFSYLKQARKRSVIVTIAMLGIALAIYFLGYWSTGTNENILTIVAVLGCLPGCKSAVSMIMLLRTRPCSEDVRDKIEPHIRKGISLYNMELTSYEATFELAHMTLVGDQLIGCTRHSKCVPGSCEKHIRDIFRQNAMSEIQVKIFTDFPKYLNRLDQLQEMEESERQEAAAAVLRAISL